MAEIETSPTEKKKPTTVGEEFVLWAEQYWNLKDKYTQSETNGSESCPYNYVATTFAQKIDEIIKNRMAL